MFILEIFVKAFCQCLFAANLPDNLEDIFGEKTCPDDVAELLDQLNSKQLKV